MQDAVRQSGDLTEAELLELEAQYCSHGDTVHYTNPPKIFTDCNGSFMYDSRGREYLDLQMWYSAVNFGYKNQRIANAVRRQLGQVLLQPADEPGPLGRVEVGARRLDRREELAGLLGLGTAHAICPSAAGTTALTARTSACQS